MAEMQIPDRYIRLAPTTFIRVPVCYVAYVPDRGYTQCRVCSVYRQCAEKQPIANRGT